MLTVCAWYIHALTGHIYGALLSPSPCSVEAADHGAAGPGKEERCRYHLAHGRTRLVESEGKRRPSLSLSLSLSHTHTHTHTHTSPPHLCILHFLGGATLF